MTDDQTLVEALRAAGHEHAADGLRDKLLADQLKAAGHPKAAELVVQETPATPAPEETPGSENNAEGEAFLQDLKDALGKNTTSIPGLLDR